MHTLSIETHRKDEVIDITDLIEEALGNNSKSGGVCTVFAKHTTCAVTTADLDPGTDLDFLEAIRKILPQLNYRHPHDPSHTPDHILSSLIGPGISIPVKNGQLELGIWQRVILVELDGPRSRNIIISFVAA